MFQHFFLFGPPPANQIIGTYDWWLVALSYVIASLASYAALDMAAQVGREQSPKLARFWHIGGAIVMGAGIWSMHFTGMLAYHMSMEHSYDLGITLLSLLLPIGFSYIVLGIVKQRELNNGTIWTAAPFLGLGMVCMHYTGMAAMQMKASLIYTPGWFAVSVLIAVLASAGALKLSFISASRKGSAVQFKVGGALVMGTAICGLHYSAMNAAVIIPFADCRIDPIFNTFNTTLALGIGSMTLTILGIAIAGLTVNRKLAEHLQDEVNRRTQEIQKANEQLLQAKEMAEAATIAKSEFLATMSHEIRTPINAIVGIATILNNDKMRPDQRAEYLSTLQLSAKSLMKLINEILDISRIEASNVELEHISVNLKELLDEMIALMSVRAREKGIEIEMHYHSQLPTHFLGDPLRLRQIIVNLLSNAVKFTTKGKVNVQVYGQPTRDSKMDIVIKVTDTGIGIAREKLAYIFGKFVQGDSSTTRRYGGSGLGLAICKGLTERMGGTISVASIVGQGSEFTVRLPLEAAGGFIQPPAVEHSGLQPGNGASRFPEASNKPRVLLVEDYPANILVATTYLNDMGFDYEVAQSGVEAVKKYAAQYFDFVLMDVQMPDMDGYEATRHIREIERQQGLPHTPIIAMTAFAYVQDRQKCLRAGMDEYMSKPITPEELRAKMEEVRRSAA